MPNIREAEGQVSGEQAGVGGPARCAGGDRGRGSQGVILEDPNEGGLVKEDPPQEELEPRSDP